MPHIWAISSEADQLIKIDPARREVTGRLTVGRAPCNVVATAETVWVVAGEDESLVRVDATRLEITARIPLPNSPNTLGLDSDGVWVGLTYPKPEAGLAHVDADSNQVRIYGDLGWPAGRVRSEFWLYQHRGFDFSPLVAVDPATGETLDRFVAWNIGSFAVDGDLVWISHQVSSGPSQVICRLNLRTRAREEEIAVPDYATNLVIVERGVWFSCYVDPGLLGRLDMGTRQLTTFDIPFIIDMAAMGTEIWICTASREASVAPDMRLCCFDARARKLIDPIDCGVPVNEIAIA